MKRSRQVQPATVLAAIALFVALGGTAYAAAMINGAEIKIRSIPGNRVELHALTGAEINRQRLGTVPKAGHASTADVATRALSEAGPTWQPLTLENGWFGSPFDTSAPAVAKLNGFIYLRGGMATHNSNPVAFTLPVADRPTHFVYVTATTCNANVGDLQIEPSGAVTVQPAGGDFSNPACFTSLDGIEFAP